MSKMSWRSVGVLSEKSGDLKGSVSADLGPRSSLILVNSNENEGKSFSGEKAEEAPVKNQCCERENGKDREI